MEEVKLELTGIWNKQFIKLWLCNLLIFTSFYALIASVPLFVIEYLHGNKEQSGWAMMVFLIFAVLFRLLSGRLLDKIGRKKILLISLIIFTLSSVLYLVIENIVALVLLRMLHGASFGASTTATGTVAADLIPEDRRGEGIGYYALSYNTAMFIGPFISLTIYSAFGFHLLFSVLSVLSFISILFALTIPFKFQPKKDDSKVPFHWKTFIEPNAIPYALTGLFLAFAFSGFLTYIPLYAQDLGIPQYASYFYIIYAIVMILSRPFIGRLVDTYKESIIIYCAIFLYAVGLVFLSQTNQPMMFLISAAIIGLGFGSLSPILQAMAIKSTTKDKTGLATGTFLSFFDTGVALGSLLLAMLAEATNFRMMYGSSTLVVITAFITFYIFQHHNRRVRTSKMEQDVDHI